MGRRRGLPAGHRYSAEDGCANEWPCLAWCGFAEPVVASPAAKARQTQVCPVQPAWQATNSTHGALVGCLARYRARADSSAELQNGKKNQSHQYSIDP